MLTRSICGQLMIEELRAEAAVLKKRLSAKRPFLRYDYPAKKSEANDAQHAIEALRRENADLRKRLGQLLSWETLLEELVDRERALRPKLSPLGQPQDATKRPRIKFKQPLTVEKCHAIVRKVYSEIATFNTSGRDGWISTGASVFGWTDQRRVENGLLKFSLRKLNTCMSPEVVSAAAWNILTTPGGYDKTISQNFGMRTEIVQVVDQSNVVMYEEYEVHSSAGGIPAVTVVRALILLTLFATEKGYILLHYGLDQELAACLPHDYLREDDTIVKYEWLPVFSWGGFDHVEGSSSQCLSSFVGTMPVEGANFVNWVVEVLLVVLRLENLIVGPQWTLPQEE